MEVVGSLLTLCVVIAALLVIIRGFRQPGGLRSYKESERVNAGTVMLTALALGALADSFGFSEPITLGLAAGLILSVIPSPKPFFVDVALSILGFLASIAVIVQFFTPLVGQVCGSTPFYVVILSNAAVILAFIVCTGIAAFFRRPTLDSGLALFGAIDIVGFLAAPLGMPLADIGLHGILIGMLVAGIFGLMSGLLPELAVPLIGAGASIAVLTTSLFAPAISPLNCQPQSPGGQFGSLIVCLIAWFIASRIWRRIGGR